MPIIILKSSSRKHTFKAPKYYEISFDFFSVFFVYDTKKNVDCCSASKRAQHFQLS